MSPKNKFRIFALVAGGLVLGAASYNLHRLWNQPVDGYWTPRVYAQELSAVTDRAEVLVKGESLQKAIAEKRVTLSTEYGTETLDSTHVTIRLNSYDHVRVTRVPQAIASAAAGGGGLVLLLIGLFLPSLGGALTLPRGLTELHLLHEQ